MIVQRLTAQIKHRAVQVEQVRKVERFRLGLFGSGFSPDSIYTGVGKAQVSCNFLSAIRFDLFALDRPKRVGIRQAAISGVELPEGARESGRSSGRLQLESLCRHF